MTEHTSKEVEGKIDIYLLGKQLEKEEKPVQQMLSDLYNRDKGYYPTELDEE